MRPSTDHRAGRMLDALLRSDGDRGRVVLTVELTKEGGSRWHETFELRRWTSAKTGRTFVFVGIPSTANWDTDPIVKPATPLRFEPATGELKRETGDPRVKPVVMYAAEAAFRFAMTGDTPSPKNGTVKVQESNYCGACGLPLRDPDSIRQGIGPDCEERLFGVKRSRRSRKMTRRAADAAGQTTTEEQK